MRNRQRIRRFLNLSAGVGMALMLFSCEDPEGFTGSDVVPVGSGFKVGQFSLENGRGDQVQGSIDINGEDGLAVNASFSDTVTALVEFRGITSGAKKSLSKTTIQLDASNLLWSGAHDGVVYFQKGEQVEVKLSFYGTKEAFRDTVTLTDVYDFKTDKTGLLEDASFDFTFNNNGYGSWWSNIGQTVSGPFPSPESKQYALLKGSANSNSTWVGGADYGARDGVYIASGNGSALPSDPSRVWFNVYVYGIGDDTPSNFSIQFLEAEETGKNQPGQDDGVLLTIPTTHKGWKLFSYKYSDLPFATYVEYDGNGNPIGGGGNGNKLHEPHQIDLISFGLESLEQGGDAQVYFDFPIFTIDGPFDPSKF